MHINYCHFCGTFLKIRMIKDSERFYCEKCDRIHYANPTVGVAVILLDKDKLLLVKRSGSYSGMWCIPCGHVEWGEDVRGAAQREFKEETGLDVEVGSVFDVHSNFHDPGKQTVGIWFIGKNIGGKLKAGSDAVDARFFPLDALPENIMAFPTDMKICSRLRTAGKDKKGEK